MRQRLGEVAKQVQSELIIVSPYLVPGPAGMKFLRELRERNVSVRILTNSLASTDMSIVHSGYQAFRVPLLEMGVELYEVRPVPGRPSMRGSQLKSPSSGLYALHAKVFVFDRQRVFVGSMNLDQRSLHLNTEIGLIIDSPELARQIARASRKSRSRPTATSWCSATPTRSVSAISSGARWRTASRWTSTQEPATTVWQRMQVDMLSLLPLDELL